MTDFKTELKSIFDKKVIEYKNVFDNSSNHLARINNLEKSMKLLDVLNEELTNKSNLILSENDNINKDELVEYIKELVLKFRDKMLNPF